MAQQIHVDETSLLPMIRFSRPSLIHDEDSFAQEYTEILEGINPRATVHYEESDSRIQKINAIITSVDKRDNERRRLLCQHMHQYLLDHNGRVTRWPSDTDYFISRSFDMDPTNTKFYFNYFGGDYIYDAEKDKIQRKPEGLVYHNAYEYDKPVPKSDNHTAPLKKECDALYADEVAQANLEVKRAKERLEEAEKHRGKRRSGFWGLLFSLLVLALIAAACIHPVHPINYQAIMSEWVPALDEKLNDSSLPSWAQLVLGILSYIPLILLYLLHNLCAVLFGLMELLHDNSVKSYIIGCVVAGVAALVLVAIINAVMPVWALFTPSHKDQREQELASAKGACDRAYQEQKRLQEEFRSSERYQAAQRKDQEALRRYEEDKAMNEAFAEEWQRAWFNYLETH